MKADCKSVRQRIDEAEREWEPEDSTKAHLAICQSCNGFYQQELKLRDLVGGLGMVQAPPDFDFRLRARLASDKTAARGFSVAGFSFGLPSAAVATLVVLLGVAFLLRGVNNEHPQQIVTNTSGVEKTKEPSTKEASTKPIVNQTAQVQAVKQEVESPGTAAPSVRQKRNQYQRRTTVAVNPGSVSKDFSSTTAAVVKPSDAISDPTTAFPIETPSDSLKLSLDDVNGVSRTISLPRFSFGSQRFVSGDASSVIKTTAKGVW